MSAEDWDEGPVEESVSDRLDLVRFRARRRLGGLLLFLHLRRLADRINPPLTPWYLRPPLGYTEHFASVDASPSSDSPEVQYEDVFLSQARHMAKQKQVKLLEVTMTEHDPEVASKAWAELRRMILQGR
ncbi:MAG TPA: hypothetical protein VIQ30_05910 [Pseudonocardia sp.]